MQILHYLTAEGRDLLQAWLDRLRDMRARIAIQRRIDRLALGNFGDHGFVGMASGSCGSMSARAIESITRRRAK